MTITPNAQLSCAFNSFHRLSDGCDLTWNLIIPDQNALRLTIISATWNVQRDLHCFNIDCDTSYDDRLGMETVDCARYLSPLWAHAPSYPICCEARHALIYSTASSEVTKLGSIHRSARGLISTTPPWPCGQMAQRIRCVRSTDLTGTPAEFAAGDPRPVCVLAAFLTACPLATAGQGDVAISRYSTSTIVAGAEP